ncbi:6092_t:CDS:2 [Cetraspora pellucida]|uniref:6092_t:CDS:1 n=1 Tax=Cetraspora pellucida TaxID=1433469 RepID=A0ACA9KXJ6_9GLOM|nr:6092_t:CDS:2 [Cetraspora pellucida]
MSLFKKIANKFNKKTNDCTNRDIKTNDLKINDNSLSEYFPKEQNWEDEKINDESTWSNDEKEVIKTPIPSSKQEDLFNETLVIKETNLKKMMQYAI